MVKAALLLACVALCGCDRGFDDVPAAPPLPRGRGLYIVASTQLEPYHDPMRFDGNDVNGAPFPLTMCPDPQIVVGLSIATNEADMPTALSLRCATVETDGVVGETSVGPRIGAEPSSDTTEQVIDCPAGWVAVSLRGGVYSDKADDPTLDGSAVAPYYVARIGIECAELKSWLRRVIFPSYTTQVGSSAFGIHDFVQGCTPQFGILKGLSGRLGNRLEQVSLACEGAGYINAGKIVPPVRN
jgi:hypothetical protein